MLKRLLGYFRPYAGTVVFATLCAVVAGASSAAPVTLIKVVVDGVLNGRQIEELQALGRFGIHIDPTAVGGQEVLLAWCVVAIVLLYLVNAVSQFAQVSTLNAVGLQVVQEMRRQLFRKYQELSLDYFGTHPTGDLMSRVIADAQVVRGTVQNVVNMFREPLTLVFLVGIAFWMNWRLALLGMVGLPLIAFSIRALSKSMRRYARRTQGHLGELTGVLNESLAGALVVRAFGLEKREIQRFEEAHDDVLKQSLKAVRASAAAGPVVIVLGALGAGAVLWVGGKQVLAGTVTAGDLMAFIVASMAAYDPIRKIARTHNSLQRVFAAGERIFSVLDTQPSVRDTGTRPAPREVEEVAFDEVEFEYEAEQPVLDGVSFVAGHGEVVAVVGESGAGKSTLLNLIPRFYDVTSGSVRINGIDIRELSIESLRRQMAVVTQDTFLFNESVSDNIRHGRPEASDEEVMEAARMAHADTFIRELPDGYETLLGERGARLSGGQRQRIAIARAILRDAPILLLDEATSSLDSESEEEVQRALEGLMVNRTTFVIAHRLSTIQNADQIVVLAGGQVAEIGSHTSLMSAGGEYQRLYDIQFRYAAAATAAAQESA